MAMKLKFGYVKIVIITLLTFLLVACGGGSGSKTLIDDESTGSSSGSGSGSSSSRASVADVRIGNLSEGVFINGVLGISETVVSEGATVSISAAFVDPSNTLLADEIEVFLTSACINNGSSTITSSPVMTVDGQISATYAPSDACLGSDIITATAEFGGETLTASVTLTVEMDGIRIGSLSGSGFTKGLLGVGDSTVGEGSSAIVSIDFVGPDNLLVSDQISVFVTSVCVDNSAAEIISSPTVTLGGSATISYTPSFDCQGEDTITATADVGGETLSAQVVVTVVSKSVNSIEFISADPSQISLSGSGGSESSEVTFVVNDGEGNPVPDRLVDFSLDTSLGGITLTSSSETSDQNGVVTAYVEAGTVATTVRVRAQVSETTFSTISDELTISTGIADQDSFSLAASILNVDGLSFDGSTTELTVHMADTFNNPVPDGTAVSFVVEGGSIEPSCTTIGGSCSVTWTSQDPRPADGIVRILAYALGNESYIDTNSNGLFDLMEFEVEDYIDSNASGYYDFDLPETFTDSSDGSVYDNGVYDKGFNDLGEPYMDINDNNRYDIGEFFVDHNVNGIRDSADHIYNGIACNADANVCDESTVAISANMRITMSDGVRSPQLASTHPTINASAQSNITITIADFKGNALPYGTSVNIEATNGVLLNSPGGTIGSVFGASTFGVSMASDGTSSNDGVLKVIVELPRGRSYFWSFSVQD